MSIHLHKVKIELNLISEPITEGVVNKLPMSRVLMLLGNDLASRKVINSSLNKQRKPVCLRKKGFEQEANVEANVELM